MAKTMPQRYGFSSGGGDAGFIGGGRGKMTRAQILLHIVNHGTYHRGFVSDLMYQILASVPANDLPVFLRDVDF
jgi:uncharacterized damage-inducible protein DinB